MINVYQIEPRNQAHSIAVQLTLFSLGYRWYTRTPGKVVQFTDAKFLVIKNDDGVGEISWSDIDLNHNVVCFDDGVFKIKHHSELVVPSRNKWRDEMELNQTLVDHPWLDEYRKNRDSNLYRANSGVERLCEYVLFLEKKLANV